MCVYPRVISIFINPDESSDFPLVLTCLSNPSAAQSEGLWCGILASYHLAPTTGKRKNPNDLDNKPYHQAGSLLML